MRPPFTAHCCAPYCLALLLLLVTHKATQVRCLKQQQQPTNGADETPTQTASAPATPQAQSQPQQSAGRLGKTQNDRLNLIEADEYGLYLVGLFDVHHSNPRVPFKCGQIDVDAGEWQTRRPMQNMEAFLWALEQVNADKSLLPGVRLGSLVLDTCSSFLRTNQQLANLLHGGNQVAGGGMRQLPGARQIMAVVADNSDWQSVEAVVSMASSLGLTTFVTQSRSTKLIELARKYKPTNQLDLSANLKLSLQGAGGSIHQQRQQQQQQLSTTMGSNSGTSSMSAADFGAQDLERRWGRTANLAYQASGATKQQQQQNQFEGLLGELLGIGKMASPQSQLQDEFNNSTSSVPSFAAADDSDILAAAADQQKLYIVRMLLGNEVLAEALASLVQQMQWDLVSVIYDDELDMVDLHDELLRQLFARNIQLALDEQVSIGAPSEAYDRLLASLARKSSHLGARVVITLLGTGSARLLLDSLHHLRSSPPPPTNSAGAAGGSAEQEQVREVNSLLWITVADREPYYSFATDALGTIAVSSSVSLLPEFRSHYDRLANEVHGAKANKWWPEYMKTILLRHQRDLELVSNECAKWQEPKASPLNERCRALTLSSLATGAGAAGNRTGSSSTTSWSPKLTKYLAGGWEHNGMDVINSVLAVANGLEAIRQALCPDTQTGLCERMRELVAAPPLPPPSAGADTTVSNGGGVNQQQQLPLVSELMYNELLRSTFQLADGRMFNLDDFNSQGGQVEGRVKLYNLRYLQPNSIGYVKFGTFDQQDGLALNSSKARHYPAGPSSSHLDQVPIEQVKSSCLDESKCLMLSGTTYSAAMGTSSLLMNKQTISEEELAAGVNSLFKLDHPLISAAAEAAVAASGLPPAESTTGNEQRQQQQRQQQQQQHQLQTIGASAGRQSSAPDDSHVRTMRSPPPIGHHFNRSSSSSSSPSSEATAAASAPSTTLDTTKWTRRTILDTIVLLPLHHKQRRRQKAGYQSSSPSSSSSSYSLAGASGDGDGGECSERLNIGHPFQHLVALAYAQNLVNNNHHLQHNHNNINMDMDNDGNGASNSSSSRRRRHQAPQIELTTTVIDYCEQPELARVKLANKLGEQQQQQQQAAGTTATKHVAVIDFDSQVGEHIDKLAKEHGLLHLSIGLPGGGGGGGGGGAGARPSTSGAKSPLDWDSSRSKGGNDQQQQLAGQPNRQQQQHHLRLSLLPSKSNEIQALVKLLGSMGNNRWKLVHLIYTDHHHYRDEFVRRANEANICVSKLIWIPSVPGADDDDDASEDDASESQHQHQHQQQQRQRQQLFQLEKTRRLFAHELHDYQQSSSSASGAGSASSQLDLDGDAQSLNTTRVLVVLASANAATNQMILEAATQSMLDDYVWITSHEWLNTVELPAEAEAAAASAASAANPDGTQHRLPPSPSLPRLFASTRLETFESHAFRHYFASLSPSIHAPLPSEWFDEFWQQRFHCRLPISGSTAAASASVASAPICSAAQHLEDAHQVIEDDRVHYVVRAIEAIHAAAMSESFESSSSSAAAAKVAGTQQAGNSFVSSAAAADSFGAKFRRAFGQLREAGGSSSGQHSPFSKLPYGFHIVHRLLPFRPPSSSSSQRQKPGATGDQVVVAAAAAATAAATSTRRQNSRNLSIGQPRQLIKVGLWRDGELILLNKKPPATATAAATRNDTLQNDDHHLSWLLRQSDGSGSGDLETAAWIAASLRQLAAVKSRCSLAQTCKLCRQQIEQTNWLIKQEEARLRQSESISEPESISSIWLLPKGRRQQSAGAQQGGGGEVAAGSDTAPLFDSVLEDGQSDGDDDDDQAENANEAAAEPAKAIGGGGGGPAKSGATTDEIQASASSLFDTATSHLVQRLHPPAAQRATPPEVGPIDRSAPVKVSPTAGQASGDAVLLAALSLLGIVCVLAGMACLYPSLLSSAATMDDDHDSSGAAANAAYDDDGSSGYDQYGSELVLNAGAGRATKTTTATSRSLSPPANLNDYFLLTGLLMLYSINIAFLLPATKGVCWFRRIGLSASYTIIFSSILVKVLISYRRSSGQKRGRHQSSSSSNSTPPSGHQRQLKQQQQQVSVDPLEESVEVTFESLPLDQNMMISMDEQQPGSGGAEHQLSSSSSSGQHQQQLAPGYQSSSSSAAVVAFGSHSSQFETGADCGDESAGSGRSSTLLPVSLSICLIVGQMVLSLVWCLRYPPEPTLFAACWHCSSPRRSPVLFLYEPLLSLLYPALILVFTWFWAVYAFRLASRNEEHYRTSTRRLLNNNRSNTHISRQQAMIAHKQSELDLKLRDSKSLVMATTLLVLTWSLMTLNMISSSQRTNKLSPSASTGMAADPILQMLATAYASSSAGHHHQHAANGGGGPVVAAALKPADQTLVYANIVSGAIVFVFLFIYRLHLLTSCARNAAHCSATLAPKSAGASSKVRSLMVTSSSYPFTSSSPPSSSSSSRGRFSTSGVLKFNGQSQAGESQQRRKSSSSSGGGIKWLGSSAASSYQISDPSSSHQFFFTAGNSSSRSSRNNQQERMRLQQFNSYGTYSATGAGVVGPDGLNNYHTSTTINPMVSMEAAAAAVAGGDSSASFAGPPETLEMRAGKSAKTAASNNGSKPVAAAAGSWSSRKKAKSRTSPSSFFGSLSSAVGANKIGSNGNGNGCVAPVAKPRSKRTTADPKLQRRQSAGSVASSTARLMSGSSELGNSMLFGSCDSDYMDDLDDTISCASSVASSSTSQLHGQDLYPIDCSIQLDSQMPDQQLAGTEEPAASTTRQPSSLSRSASFSRRSFRQSMSKLSSVKEEQMPPTAADIITTSSGGPHKPGSQDNRCQLPPTTTAAAAAAAART